MYEMDYMAYHAIKEWYVGYDMAMHVSHMLTPSIPVTRLEKNKNIKELIEIFCSWVIKIGIHG